MLCSRSTLAQKAARAGSKAVLQCCMLFCNWNRSFLLGFGNLTPVHGRLMLAHARIVHSICNSIMRSSRGLLSYVTETQIYG